MPKIDVTKIEGYSTMTNEQKLAALEAYEIDESAELARNKALLTRANSEAAEWKRKHTALLSAEDQKKVVEEEKDKRLKELEDQVKLNESIASLVENGYDRETAKASAEAYMKGDMATFLANQQKVIKEKEKNALAKAKEQLVNGITQPQGSSSTSIPDLQAQITEARKNGDMAQVAALIRQSQEKTIKTQ